MTVVLPKFPWSRSRCVEVFQFLPVFERIHTGPKSVVDIREQLLLVHKPLKRFCYQFFIFMNVIEDVPFEDEIPAVDAQIAFIDGTDLGDQAAAV